MATFKNYTPHPVKLNDGRVFPSLGVARVDAKLSHFDKNGVCIQIFGEVTGLPEPEDCVIYIVSSIVLNVSKRADLVAPATGHPETIRDEKGFIVSVPGFVR